MEAPWDAQLDIERALLEGEEFTVITADYNKFFDTFDHDVFRELAIACGIPKKVARLVFFLM